MVFSGVFNDEHFSKKGQPKMYLTISKQVRTRQAHSFLLPSCILPHNIRYACVRACVRASVEPNFFAWLVKLFIIYRKFYFYHFQDNSDEVRADSENPTQAESKSETSQNAAAAAVDTPSDSGAEEQSNTEHEIQLNIDTNATLPNDVTELVVRYLQSLKIEDDIKAKEVILTLWDFAGQHLYYASHSVFLSERAVYVLVYNLSKNLMAEAEPCVRQGIHDIVLDNPNSETNLDNLLSWLVSIHSIRATDGEVNRDFKNSQAKLSYLRPPVFIVGTNADHPVQPAKEMTKCIQRSIAGKTYKKHVIPPFFTVDNTKSHSDEGVKELRKKIMEVLEQEPYMGEEVPLRYDNDKSNA